MADARVAQQIEALRPKLIAGYGDTPDTRAKIGAVLAQYRAEPDMARRHLVAWLMADTYTVRARSSSPPFSGTPRPFSCRSLERNTVTIMAYSSLAMGGVGAYASVLAGSHPMHALEFPSEVRLVGEAKLLSDLCDGHLPADQCLRGYAAQV